MKQIISRNEHAQRHGISLHMILLLISVVLTLLFVLIEFFQFYFSTSDYLQSNQLSLDELRFTNSKLDFSEEFSQMETVARLVVFDPQIQTLLNGTTQKTFSVDQKIRTNLQQLLYKGMLIQPQIDSVFIFTDYGAYWAGGLVPSSTKKDLFLSSYQITAGDQWHVPERTSEHVIPISTLSNRFFYVLPFTVHQPNDHCVVVVAKTTFLSNLSEKNHLVGLLSPSGEVLLNQTTFSDRELQAEHLPATLRTAELSNGLMLMFEMQSSSRAINRQIFRLNILVLLPLLLVLAFVLSSILSKPLTRPLKIFRQQLTSAQAMQELPRLRNYPVSIHEWILLNLLITTFTCCLLVSTALSSHFVSISTESFEVSSEESFQQTATSTDNFFSNFYSAALHFGFSNNLYDLFDRDAPVSDFSDYLDQAKNFFSHSTNLALYRPDGTLLSSTGVAQLTLDCSTLPTVSKPVWYLEQQSSSWSISLLWPIVDLTKSQVYGYFLSQVQESELSSLYHNLSPDHPCITLVAEDGTVFSSTEKQVIGQPVQEDLSETLCFSQDISKTPFTLVASFDRNSLYVQQKSIQLQIVYSLLCILVLSLISSLLLSHFLSSHLNQIFQQIVSLEASETKLFSEDRSMISELNDINTIVADLSQNVLILKQQTAEAEKRNQELELAHQHTQFAMLQAQINPHFLYNSFEVIISLILQHRNADAADMLNAISSMLRYSLRSDSPLVSLEEEVRYARTYLDVMQLRQVNSLYASFDFPDDVLHQRVPRFILQPLLENAIKHGFQPKGEQGTIHVMGKIIDEMIVLSVRDDGIGMTQEELQTLQAQLNRATSDYSHIGLSNIHHRLRLYGDNYGLQIISNTNTGTVVILSCPLNL